MPTVLIATYLVTVALRVVLAVLNLRHRRLYGHAVPAIFIGSIDVDKLRASNRYNSEREYFGVARLLVSTVLIALFLFGGGLEYYDRWTVGLVGSNIGQGVIFFVGLELLSSLLDLPFDAFSTFRIEQRHGFNRTTFGLFVADWLKGVLLTSVLVAAISAAGLGLFYASPHWYWLWFWGVTLLLGILLMLISPYVIEPLFIKTKPITNAELTDNVQRLADKVGVKISRVLEMDASRRTSHSNAYFTGIGRVKRVVLFDTLLERLNEAEVLAVLGHELGHWKLRHVTQRLVTTALLSLAGLYLAAQLIASSELAGWIGLEHPTLAARVVMLGFLASLLGFITTPLSAYWSRRHERQADDFAAKLTERPSDLASALVKLARDNLSNLHPHPLFAAFYYSHPTTSERVQRLSR